MKPINFQSSNCIIGGEIPANKTHGMVLSRWRASWHERLQVLIFGTVWVAMKGDTMPPTLISGDQSFEITNP